eukprot:1343709-Rhodomonas_salina.1
MAKRSRQLSYGDVLSAQSGSNTTTSLKALQDYRLQITKTRAWATIFARKLQELQQTRNVPLQP